MHRALVQQADPNDSGVLHARSVLVLKIGPLQQRRYVHAEHLANLQVHRPTVRARFPQQDAHDGHRMAHGAFARVQQIHQRVVDPHAVLQVPLQAHSQQEPRVLGRA